MADLELNGNLMANFIDTPHGNTIAYNQFIGKKTGIVFLSGFKSDMKVNKALYLENWAKDNDHSFLRFDYSGHGESSGKIDKKTLEISHYLANRT